MLVLSRREDESIVIEVPGEEPVIVTVVSLNGYRARLGIEAPREVLVARAEVFERIQAERAEAIGRAVDAVVRPVLDVLRKEGA